MSNNAPIRTVIMRYVYCHPLFDERKCAQRFSFQLKHAFEVSGLILERFDYRGTGEAKGKFSDVSLETLQEDIVTQVGRGKICLIGLRLGASLAFDYCAHHTERVKRLILIEPIVDGAGYVDYIHRRQHIKDLLTGDTRVDLQDDNYKNIEGYKTNIRFIGQIKALNLIEMAREHSIESTVLIVQISSRPKIDLRIAELAKVLKNSAERVSVESMNLPQFWERIPTAHYHKLVDAILGWCHG